MMIDVSTSSLTVISYKQELTRQCQQALKPCAVLAIFAWFPFIYMDRLLYPELNAIVYLRLGLSVFGILVLLVISLARHQNLSYGLLYGIVFYLEFATGTILGIVNADPVYMGTLSVVLIITPIFPFQKRHSFILILVATLMFFISGMLNKISFTDPDRQYTLFNVLVAFVVAMVSIFVLDFIRRSFFSRQKLLADRKAQIEEQKIELRDALDSIKILRGLLPICSHCKSIRDSKGYWHDVELYIQNKSDASFSHSLCKKCIDKYYPEIRDKIQ